MTDKSPVPKYKRRISTDIMMCLLEYLEKHQKAKKTWLLNESRMNSRTFEPHFKQLLEKKFIEYDNKNNLFRLTETGKSYLKVLRDVSLFDSKWTLEKDGGEISPHGNFVIINGRRIPVAECLSPSEIRKKINRE